MYEIRPLSFGELLDTGFRIVRNHAKLLISLGLVLYLPLGLLQGTIGSLQGQLSPGTGTEMVGTIIAAQVGVLLFLMIMSPVLFAAITHAVAESYLGHNVTFGNAMRLGFSLFLPLVGTSLIYGLIVFAVVGVTVGAGVAASAILEMPALLFIVVPGAVFLVLRLFLSYLLVWQVMVIERDFGLSALRRSATLMRGSLLRGLGVMVVSSVLMGLLSGGTALVLFGFPFASGFFSGIMQSLSMVYTSAVSVALYFDLRCRKEAFDLEHLAQLVERGAAPQAAPL